MTGYGSDTEEGTDLDDRDVRALTEYLTVLENQGRVRGRDGLCRVVYRERGAAATQRTVRHAAPSTASQMYSKGTIEQAERASEAQVGVAEGDQAMLEGECGVARIEQGSEDRQVDVQQFESRKEALRYRFQTTVK